MQWGTSCSISVNGARVCWIEEKHMVIHIYGMTLNTAKSADQYYSSYSYQSSSLISYLMYSDLHHDCKPYEQTIALMFHSLLVRKWIITETAHIWFFLNRLVYISNTNRKLNTTNKNSISCAIIVFVWMQINDFDLFLAVKEVKVSRLEWNSNLTCNTTYCMYIPSFKLISQNM